MEPSITPRLVNAVSEPLICHVTPSEIANVIGEFGQQAKNPVFKANLERKSFNVVILDLNKDDPGYDEINTADLQEIGEGLISNVMSKEGVMIEVCTLAESDI